MVEATTAHDRTSAAQKPARQQNRFQFSDGAKTAFPASTRPFLAFGRAV